jgi:hypothetical protein
MINRLILALTLACLSSGALHVIAAESTAVPPSAIPGINQGQSAQSNDDKASKKGEEASGSNSGADAQTTEKDSASSDDGSTQRGSDAHN